MNTFIRPGLSSDDAIKQKNIVIDKFFSIIGEYFDITKTEMKSKCRNYEIVKARFWCIWFFYYHVGCNKSFIGRLFNRDHATVIHAIKMINDQISPITKENVYKDDYENLKKLLIIKDDHEKI